MRSIPDCPNGRDDCLFESGYWQYSATRGKTLMNRRGEVTVIPAVRKTSTSAKCETCGKAFVGEGTSDADMVWREAEGFIVHRLVVADERHAPEPAKPPDG